MDYTSYECTGCASLAIYLPGYRFLDLPGVRAGAIRGETRVIEWRRARVRTLVLVGCSSLPRVT